MTDLQRNLDLIAKSIDTQYDLARIALFGLLERACPQLDRFTTAESWGPRDFDGGNHSCSHPVYRSLTLDGLHLTTEGRELLNTRVAPIGQEVGDIVKSTRDPADVIASELVVVDHIAVCKCGAEAKPLSQLTLKVSFTWHGRTLTREYLLPEGK